MPGPPILLAKWYDYAKWIIERVDSFPKNQRFIFGQRLAGHVDVAQASGLPYRSASSLPPRRQIQAGAANCLRLTQSRP